MQGIFRHLVLIGRIVIGGVFVAHGWQKLTVTGIPSTETAFTAMHIPFPQIVSYFAAVTELGGGLALVIGLFLPLAGLLLAIDMLGAFFFVEHHGIFVQAHGFELVGALGVSALLLGFSGGETLALDRALFKSSDRRLKQP